MNKFVFMTTLDFSKFVFLLDGELVQGFKPLDDSRSVEFQTKSKSVTFSRDALHAADEVMGSVSMPSNDDDMVRWSHGVKVVRDSMDKPHELLVLKGDDGDFDRAVEAMWEWD